MINDAQPAHLAAHGFQYPRAEAVSVAERCQMGKKLSRSVLELDKDGQKYPLLAAITGEQKLGKLVQPLDSGDLVAVELDFCARHISHPCLFHQNRAFLRGSCTFDDVKIFSFCRRPLRGNRPLPKTLRFRAEPAQHSTFSGIGYLEDGLHIWIPGLTGRIC